ncbi:MAG: hypothetical protein R3321_10080 [Nitrososphaeraceae archaeon]|nr:hypothetical protein [Nitrososphaeraceae archaeon]
MISDVLFNNRLPENYIFDDLHNVLVNSSLETLPLWILGSNYKEQEIIDELIEQGNPPMEYTFILANREISRRNYHKATEYLEEYLEVIPVAERANVFPIHLYLLCMTGKIDEANELANAVASLYPVNRQNLKFFKWMHTTFKLNIPDIYRNNIN